MVVAAVEVVECQFVFFYLRWDLGDPIFGQCSLSVVPYTLYIPQSIFLLGLWLVLD